MSMLGHVIGLDFSDLLIKDCLTIAIPSNKNDLQDFCRIIEETSRFQEFLVSVGFLHADQKTILEYARNVDALFANKMCRDVLDKARKLMLMQLHDTVQLTAPSDANSVPKSSENKLNNVFIFPTCQISASVKQLMDFAYEVLNEASESSAMCAIRLFYTVRNIFELFCAIVPIFHKQNITMLPQVTVSALHHNNCMYLAHHLITLGHEFSSRLHPSLKDNTVTFVDLVPRLRTAGTDAFQSQLAAQKKQLVEIIRGIGSFHNMSNDPNFTNSLERALKQCLYQLEHLQRIWQTVLPSSVYKQTMGALLDSLLDEIIGQIVRQEDIPSNCTHQLTTAFSVIIQRTPNLFQPLSYYGNNGNNENYSVADACRCVPKWMKFKELLLMLAASMNDILERWAEGKGPLAHEFTANEIKQVIRALFQNTDRRSAVLARINHTHWFEESKNQSVCQSSVNLTFLNFFL
uniref:Uncharacterized protein n=1 Tax=Strigamia maritima TaxID=126957 RepID=T1JGN2_STRMM